MTQPQWDDARVFLAVVRQGTLSGAAKRLGLGVATVSRRLERLEQALGVPLFSRHQSGYRLTEDGVALRTRAEALEAAGNAFSESASRRMEVAGSVRLATAENLANPIIVPSLGALFAQYPELRVEIVSGISAVNLHRRDADIAVRMVRPESGNLTVRRLATLGYGLYAAQAYLQGRRTEQIGIGPDDDIVTWGEDSQHLPAATWMRQRFRGRPPRLATNTLSAQLIAVQDGMGLAVLPHFLAHRAGLVCLDNKLGIDQPIWLVTHTDLGRTLRVSAVAEHLTTLFTDLADELAGADVQEAVHS